VSDCNSHYLCTIAQSSLFRPHIQICCSRHYCGYHYNLFIKASNVKNEDYTDENVKPLLLPHLDQSLLTEFPLSGTEGRSTRSALWSRFVKFAFGWVEIAQRRASDRRRDHWRTCCCTITFLRACYSCLVESSNTLPPSCCAELHSSILKSELLNQAWRAGYNTDGASDRKSKTSS
jgi:hypothetical protein